MPDDPEDLAELIGTGRLLRQERLQQRVTQSLLARRSGVRQPTISRIEAGSMVPTWSTLVRLLAALDLQPSIAAVPLGSDVAVALRRLDGLSVEQLCADLEPWLSDISDATAEDAAARTGGLLGGVSGPVPMAICGATAAQVLRLPVRARRIDLMAGADAGTVGRALAWVRSQLMRPLDPDTRVSLPEPPTVEDVLAWGHLLAEWAGRTCRIVFDPDFGAKPVVRLRVFGVDVPVLGTQALCDTDPWLRRVVHHLDDDGCDAGSGGVG